MKDHENRGGSVDSDILQGKADVLRVVRALAEQGSAPAAKRDRDPRPVQVQVRPVVAIRSERGQSKSSQQKEDSDLRPGSDRPEPAAIRDAEVEKTAKEEPTLADEKPSAAVAAESKDAVSPMAAAPEAAVESEAEQCEAPEAKCDALPRFKLAEQILAEQRRSASERRQRAAASEPVTRTYERRTRWGGDSGSEEQSWAFHGGSEQGTKPAVKCWAAADEDTMTPIQRKSLRNRGSGYRPIQRRRHVSTHLAGQFGALVRASSGQERTWCG